MVQLDETTKTWLTVAIAAVGSIVFAALLGIWRFESCDSGCWSALGVWFQGVVILGTAVIALLTYQHQIAERRRRLDLAVHTINDCANSIRVNFWLLEWALQVGNEQAKELNFDITKVLGMIVDTGQAAIEGFENNIEHAWSALPMPVAGQVIELSQVTQRAVELCSTRFPDGPDGELVKVANHSVQKATALMKNLESYLMPRA